ncbi:hypothetical protein HELRODRAFT_184411 [Helobdella robusta]|uniref:Uncharacterized protein n=1 Tax=Helobdella robusta TaxID=6412 RepID=T1FL53_HELRO|nr:hypothetical protein HELRODRAFT_184411 [Helobdella robusta]ESN98201.1 hypothetical protein HELRODRAFT_184411 [Helobdella robusta]
MHVCLLPQWDLGHLESIENIKLVLVVTRSKKLRHWCQKWDLQKITTLGSKQYLQVIASTLFFLTKLIKNKSIQDSRIHVERNNKTIQDQRQYLQVIASTLFFLTKLIKNKSIQDSRIHVERNNKTIQDQRPPKFATGAVDVFPNLSTWYPSMFVAKMFSVRIFANLCKEFVLILPPPYPTTFA